MNTENKSLAKSRWALLQEAIINKRVPEPQTNPASKRGFQKFSDLIAWTDQQGGEEGEVVVKILIEKEDKESSVGGQNNHEIHHHLNNFKNNHFRLHNNHHHHPNNIRHNDKKSPKNNNNKKNKKTSCYKLTVFRSTECVTLQIDDLRGFDKTGRICIWPAEQVLTYWCLKNDNLFEGKVVIEIGGGFHCLAGLAIAKFVKAKEVILTDGDPTNVEQVRKSLKNNNALATKSVSAAVLHWDGYATPEFEGRFDQVLAADVVYETSVFDPLIKTVSKLLKSGGQFILLNPTRDATLKNLISTAREGELFREIQVVEEYDNQLSLVVSKLEASDPSFNKNWHYPHQVIFYK